MSNFINKTNTSIVYRSKLFRGEQEREQQKKPVNTRPVHKLFCKVCQDAGKSDQECTNHSVRDKSGKTVCPTLLSQCCRNCGENGHTVKYCPLLKARSEPEKKAPAPIQKQAYKSTNAFIILESDSEEEGEILLAPMVFGDFPIIAPALTIDEKPKLNYRKIIQQVNDPESYAKAKREELEAKRQAELIKLAKLQAIAETDREARELRLKSIKKTSRWVDAESSDEEDEDEEVVDNSAW